MSKFKICKSCGRKFISKSNRQQYCGEMVDVTCPICGKTFQTRCSSNMKKTCSESCNAQYIKKQRESSAKLSTKICKWCGAEFHPLTVRDVYCRNQHYQTCLICGKQFEIDPRTNPDTKTCSDDCRYKLMMQNTDIDHRNQLQKEAFMKKYGVENPMQIGGVIDKIKSTNKEKYGADWYTQTDEYKEKCKQTDLLKYGVEHHLQSEEVRSKIIQSVKDKYDVDNVFKSEDIKDKIKETTMQNYGVEFISQSDEFRQTVESNNLKKYGVRYPSMLPDFVDKVKKTNIEKYGTEWYTQKHISNLDNWYMFIKDPKAYIEEHYQESPRTAELAADLGVDLSTIDLYLGKYDARSSVIQVRSVMEREIRQFLLSVDPDIEIISNTRSIIAPLELDLWLPQYNIGIECNPTCTHNSSIKFLGNEILPKNYHAKKTHRCEECNIFLFHIFGYEWKHKRSIIESMLRNLLSKNTRKVYARKCEVKLVDFADCKKFLNDNHRQGAANSKIRLGLYYENELVSVMTFGKMRSTIGVGNNDLSNCYELVRFCSLLNTTVVGGADKLFKYFISNYQPERVRSFSDKAHTRGKLYENLGFKEIKESSPGYVWVDLSTDIAYHRVNAQKHNLKQFLKDDNIDLEKSETQIMIEHGYVQVYDSGIILWEWVNRYCKKRITMKERDW